LLADNHGSEIQAILSRYPDGEKRSAVMALLYLAQQEYGLITKKALVEVGALAGLDPTQVAGLAGFYSLFQDHLKGKRRIRICTDLSCSLRGAEQFAADLCANLGVELGQTTPDGEFTVEAVTCLAGCDKAPLFQVEDCDGVHYFESESADRPMTAAEALDMLNAIKKEDHIASA
jgi:NADH-quinone oxidoreductase subunit E